MTVDEFSQYLSWAIYALILVLSVVRAARHPLRANVDIALFFAIPGVVIALSLLAALDIIEPGPLSSAVTTSLVLAMGYMLLRLVDDFADVPRWLRIGAPVALAALILASFAYSPPRPAELLPLQLAYLIGLLLYTTSAFVRESMRSNGVTKRRLQAIAFGSISLVVLFSLAGAQSFLPELRGLWVPLTDVAVIASAIGYFLGFATPGLLRRAWQEPELRAFLGRAARLPRLPSTVEIVAEMERGAAASLGAPAAAIGLFDEELRSLRFSIGGREVNVALSEATTAGRAFHEQRSIYAPQVSPDNPRYADAQIGFAVRTVIAAPITAGEKRLGVLAALAARPPVFAEEDMELVQLLADQAAVILESRALIDEAARVRAREHVTRLKEDFLSAAAHDLKTPLTILVAQTELLERRARRDPQAPADLPSLERLKREAHRLRSLVLEFLDAAMTEQGSLLGTRQEIDLVSYAMDACERHNSERHPCRVEAEGPVRGAYDANRIQQLIENLVENAVKYSPHGGMVLIKAWREEGWNHLTVSDNGIGIPREDLAGVFERFHRGSNVDDRQFAGMGLGLYICRGIVEQHGGRIWVESRRIDGANGGNSSSANSNRGNSADDRDRLSGSTFHVVLPTTTTSIAVPASSGGSGGETAGD